MTSELVFSVKEIFSDYLDKAGRTSPQPFKYHIPAYQRGYKWSSEPNGAVNILLDDLMEAFTTFQSQGHKEYYLQYITLKKHERLHYLEVIDGQQRLTTISLLLTVFARKLKIKNIAANKLDYAIRGNFFNDHIYNPERFSTLLSTAWHRNKGLLLPEPINDQDIFYIQSAAKRIDAYLSEIHETQLQLFYEFILSSVKLIVNLVDRHVVSERVFSNLNSNKIALTESELVKGLIITRVSREHLQNSAGMTYREMLEYRMVVGRQWDEISRWMAEPAVKSFYFPETGGMHGLLKLVAESFETKTNKLDRTKEDKDYPLFNFFHRLGNVSVTYERIREYAACLRDWYDVTGDFNSLGFCLFAQGNGSKRNTFLAAGFTMDKSAFRRYLLKEIIRLLPQRPASELLYGDANTEIHRMLLALNVFGKGREVRFDFHTYDEQKWSLEHIFPQSPEGKNNILEEEDKQQIIDMLGDAATEKIKAILKKKVREDKDKQVYYAALQQDVLLNSIGNMCLLTSSDNSSNGCGFFNDKRKNILKRISEGSFVPRHTFEVFSKMVISDDPGSLRHWSKENIKQHTKSIQSRIDEIRQKLNNENW